MQVSLALSEAVVTALVTAKNFTVTVNFNGSTNTVNTTQVVDVFLAGLQDGVTPCARNVTSNSTATAGSTAYFENISSVRASAQSYCRKHPNSVCTCASCSTRVPALRITPLEKVASQMHVGPCILGTSSALQIFIQHLILKHTDLLTN